MWFDALSDRDLQRVHDRLSRAVFLLLDTLDGEQPPEWVKQAIADVRAMYAVLWARRRSGGDKPQEEAS